MTRALQEAISKYGVDVIVKDQERLRGIIKDLLPGNNFAKECKALLYAPTVDNWRILAETHEKDQTEHSRAIRIIMSQLENFLGLKGQWSMQILFSYVSALGWDTETPVDITENFKERTVSIQSLSNGKFLGADLDQPNTPIFAHRPINQLWEQFKVEINEDGWAALRACNNGKYISAHADKEYTPLFANTDNFLAWECFKILLFKGNTIFQSAVNNKYVMADIGCTISADVVGLYACADIPQAWEQFSISIIG
jgi:hypothetical protein